MDLGGDSIERLRNVLLLLPEELLLCVNEHISGEQPRIINEVIVKELLDLISVELGARRFKPNVIPLRPPTTLTHRHLPNSTLYDLANTEGQVLCSSIL